MALQNQLYSIVQAPHVVEPRMLFSDYNGMPHTFVGQEQAGMHVRTFESYFDKSQTISCRTLPRKSTTWRSFHRSARFATRRRAAMFHQFWQSGLQAGLIGMDSS